MLSILLTNCKNKLVVEFFFFLKFSMAVNFLYFAVVVLYNINLLDRK